MQNRDIVVIGASSGGVEALTCLVQELPSDLPAALFVVMHFSSFSQSVLPKILSRSSALPALHPEDYAAIEPGQIYVAPPDFHLVVQPGLIRLSHGARENGFRPAVDVLFRSAARAYGRRVVGVVLSGALDDGTAGLAVIKSHGGIALVQDPAEALMDGMPNNAIANVAVDHILEVKDIAACIERLAYTPIEEEAVIEHNELDREEEIVAQDKAALEKGARSGSPSPFTCPDCGGVLWELNEGNLLRYRCHVGHAYSIESLAAEQSDSVEAALWAALRALEEKAALSRRMAFQAKQRNQPLSEAQFSSKAEEIELQAAAIRQLVLRQDEKKRLQ
jgi:two-component system, chemotaxis family, protein-glutamate methylesterase/glutaminase